MKKLFLISSFVLLIMTSFSVNANSKPLIETSNLTALKQASKSRVVDIVRGRLGLYVIWSNGAVDFYPY